MFFKLSSGEKKYLKHLFFKKRPDDILNIVLFPFVLLLGFSVIASYRNSGSNVLKNFKNNNNENEILI